MSWQKQFSSVCAALLAAVLLSGCGEKAVLKKIHDGDIVLLHDMSDSSVRAALDIIDALLAQNYEIVTVSRLAKLRNCRLRPGRSIAALPENS